MGEPADAGAVVWHHVAENHRMRLPFVLLALAMAPLPAQRVQASPSVQRWLLHPPGAAAAAWTLWCVLPGYQNLLCDQSSYLSLLQRRFGDRGLRVVVLLRGAAADATPVDPGAVYSLGCLDAEGGRTPGTWGDYSPARLLDRHGREVWSGLLAQGPAPAIDQALQGKVDVDGSATAARLRSDLLIRIGDGGVFRPQIDQLLLLAPGDAHALALSYLDQLATGDPAAARRTVQQAIAELRQEPLPLFAFADLALRAERDPESRPPDIATCDSVRFSPSTARFPSSDRGIGRLLGDGEAEAKSCSWEAHRDAVDLGAQGCDCPGAMG